MGEIKNFKEFIITETSVGVIEPTTERETLNKKLNDVFFEKLTKRPLRKKYSKLPKSYTKVKGTGEKITKKYTDEDGYSYESIAYSSVKLTMQFPPSVTFTARRSFGYDGKKTVFRDFVATGVFIEVKNDMNGNFKTQIGFDDGEYYDYVEYYDDDTVKKLISFLEDNL